jgi:hypothetical protein
MKFVRAIDFIGCEALYKVRREKGEGSNPLRIK